MNPSFGFLISAGHAENYNHFTCYESSDTSSWTQNLLCQLRELHLLVWFQCGCPPKRLLICCHCRYFRSSARSVSFKRKWIRQYAQPYFCHRNELKAILAKSPPSTSACIVASYLFIFVYLRLFRKGLYEQEWVSFENKWKFGMNVLLAEFEQSSFCSSLPIAQHYRITWSIHHRVSICKRSKSKICDKSRISNQASLYLCKQVHNNDTTVLPAWPKAGLHQKENLFSDIYN